MTTAKHFTTDHHSADASTSYWFELDGNEYAIAEAKGEEPDALDADGCPLPQGAERDRVLAQCIVTETMRQEVESDAPQDALAAHIQQWREAWETYMETGFDESLEEAYQAHPVTSLSLHDAKVRESAEAGALEKLAKNMEANGYADEASGVRAYATQ